jgi:hypothetical protein
LALFEPFQFVSFFIHRYKRKLISAMMEKKAAQVIYKHEVKHIKSHQDKSYALTKVNTLGINVENRDAVKGDDSDRKIDWT